MTDLLLNIAAISRRTGVAPDTLRKWESRYGALRPSRTAGGQRRYDEADVQRVEWLRDRIAEGWRIGEAARMLDAESSALDDPVALRDTLIAAIRGVDLGSITATLDQTFAVLPLERALNDVVTPALHWIGEAWHRGEISIAQEHAISAKVRAHLTSLMADARADVRGLAVLACGPGEFHDLGLLMLAVALRADGWRVEYLGADTPADTAIEFAEKIGATILCFSAARDASLEALRVSLVTPTSRSNVPIVIGGGASTPELARELGATHVSGDLGAAVTRLRRLARA
ncbi:MerR family transcriptional regulator [Gaiella sp.]|uniref:MerR family transcriptional regulator n=1 Tax=Gaiella sp. TaxID=2663207 RepID=UPI003983AC4C